MSHVLCQTRLGRLEASLGCLHLHTLLRGHSNRGRKVTFVDSTEH